MCSRTIYCTNIDKKVIVEMLSTNFSFLGIAVRSKIITIPMIATHSRLLKQMSNSFSSIFVERLVAAEC